MICKFKKTVQQYNMFSYGDTVIAGVSGGADSMTLLNMLNSIKDEYSLKIIVAHVNHCLRGEEADRDMDFVINQAKKLSLPCKTLVFDVKKEAERTHESFEECGRRIRYDFFKSIDENAKIATAHNLCDNEETFILNLSRGTGISGLKGISYKRGNIVRPLLNFKRQEIEKYCEENDISYVNDSTNECDEYKRNFIRHHILPEIKKLNSSFDTAFLNCVTFLNDDYDFILNEVQTAVSLSKSGKYYDLEKLKSYHKAIYSKSLMKIVEDETGAYPEKKHIDILLDAIENKTSKVQITNGYFAVVKNNMLCFLKEIEEAYDVSYEIEYDKEYDFFSNTVIVSSSKQNVYNEFLFDRIDCDKIIGKLSLRNRREGDKFTISRRNVTKSLKKLFCEESIDLNERYKVPIIADDKAVLWVNGFGVNKSYEADDKTKNILYIYFKKKDERNAQ